MSETELSDYVKLKTPHYWPASLYNSMHIVSKLTIFRSKFESVRLQQWVHCVCCLASQICVHLVNLIVQLLGHNSESSHNLACVKQNWWLEWLNILWMYCSNIFLKWLNLLKQIRTSGILNEKITRLMYL